MKLRPAIILLFILLSISNITDAQNKRAARETIWELLAKNNPDAHYFMTKLYEMPVAYTFGNMQVTLSEETDFMEFVDHYKMPEILDDISTAVHEACHGYESRKPYEIIAATGLPYEFGESYSVYYVSRDEEYLVKQSATFPSKEMARDIPEKYRTFRYKSYISANSEYLGTQQKGIFGLLDELTAYYNGFKTTVLNFPEYQDLAKNNAVHFLKYIEHASSQKVAFYEFSYYILHYLSYASIHHPEMYSSFMENTALTKAYKAVSRAYSDILLTYENNIRKIQTEVEARGEYFSSEDGTIWIGNDGIGTFSDDEAVLKEAIGSLKYQKIIEGMR